jgi:glutathione peroxidase
MRVSRLFRKKIVIRTNEQAIPPPESIYDFSVKLNNGSELPLSSFHGKKILLVNTASDCGYTPQYDDLEKLYEQNRDKLVIIGFPANDFGEQEKGDDETIASFCKINFGVSFPLAKKSTVIRAPQQNEIFNWLSDKKRNGWNDQAPTWNFSKYLLNEQGVLTHYFDPAISPGAEEVLTAI